MGVDGRHYILWFRIARSIPRNRVRVNLGLDVRPLTSPPVCEALAPASGQCLVAAFGVFDFAVVEPEIKFHEVAL